MLPTFETERLFLKEPTNRDFESYQKYFNNYEVIRHLSAGVPWPFPEDGVQKFLEEKVFPEQGKTTWMWGIFLKEFPEELIGAIQYFKTDDRPENRGFWLGEPFWGKGYMTEAALAILDYGFDELKLDVLCFANAVGNVKSRRVKEKTGCKFVRVEPYKFVDPRLTEHEIWELHKNDWNKSKN